MTKILFTLVILNIITFSTGQLIQLRPSEFRKLSREGYGYSPFSGKPLEPNCEDLKAMWRFSTRQAKASELTNNLPTFKDPFAYNIWKKHPDTRYLTYPRRTTGRMRYKPVYGRVVYHPPSDHTRELNPDPSKYYGRVAYTAPSDHPRVFNPDLPKHYGVVRYYEPTEEEEAHRNYGLAATFGPPNRKQKGSFDRLKELVYAERMKEMNKQLTHPVGPIADKDSPKLNSARASAPLSASAPVPSPTPAPTPLPPSSPPPAGVPLPMKEIPVRVSRPYDAGFRGQQSSDHVHPYDRNRSTRLQIISDYFKHKNLENTGIDDGDEYNEDEDHGEHQEHEEYGGNYDNYENYENYEDYEDYEDYGDEEELPYEDIAYGTPYRLKGMFIGDAPYFDL